MNGSTTTSAAEDSMRAFQEVHLEAIPQQAPSTASSTATPDHNVSSGDRGERVKEEISMLSPTMPQAASVGGSGGSSKDSNAPRPDELNIKPLAPSKPLPVPTPSREATLTQKLEQALGSVCPLLREIMVDFAPFPVQDFGRLSRPRFVDGRQSHHHVQDQQFRGGASHAFMLPRMAKLVAKTRRFGLYRVDQRRKIVESRHEGSYR